MTLKIRLLGIFAGVGLAFGGSVSAAPRNQKSVPPVKTNTQKEEGQGAEKKAACEALNAQAKELWERERQLRAQAKERLAERKALLAQANQSDRQRLADEHSRRRGEHAAESQLKSQHENLEHQATEKAKESEALTKQADELERQQRAIEQQHKQECEVGVKR